ncbi:AAA family ATPase [Actinokineospora bangkokensis]|uniref:ATPase n=1 Tax=Actinokineospora bangkokensis TaxID=1193682 RepID=A0A1Q9LR72_9PSEU|nr:MoxR family ATPase [Actinokineospora bangkokensis]OLR94520.1 ATPase [Actinokineospora bangkokensis]
MDGANQGNYRHVSAAPTLPGGAHAGAAADAGEFDVAALYSGPLTEDPAAAAAVPLDEKLRQAYFWIVNHAIISPHYDVEFSDGPSPGVVLGDSKARLTLPSGQSYSSFVLIPLLTFAVRRRCLLVGGPGRGKTASAVLMGVLAGYPLREVRRAMQHGHPQLTIADLLGTPLPADLVKAERITDIDIAWRSWLPMRVKIVDEYNRIPTRTQSALLTLMSDGYAEVFDQVYEAADAAWYLTANDDAGGGTYQVIEALRDRIDVVVHALQFNSRFLGELVQRIERRLRPEEVVPPEIVFSAAEHDRVQAEILRVPLPPPVLRRLEFFSAQFELLEQAGEQFEYRTKDTARLAGVDPHLLSVTETGRDRVADLGAQTLNGLSVRALQSVIAYAKALAYFRDREEVGLDDLRAVLPFVLHDKLVPDDQAPSFDEAANRAHRTDRVSWLRSLFDRACAEYDRLDLDVDDPVGVLLAEFDRGLDGVGEAEVTARLSRIESLLAEWARGRKLHGHVYDDALALKYLHQRYVNYRAWLRWRP